MGMHGPLFTRRRTLPLVKRGKKRVRIFVAEKISGFIQLQRGMQQIMLREFASRFFNQLLEFRAFRSQAALQRTRAQPQFASNILQSWPLAREKLLQNSFDLFLDCFSCELSGQFGFQLWCNQGKELGIVCQERLVEVRFAEDQHVVACVKFPWALEVALVEACGKTPGVETPRASDGWSVWCRGGRWRQSMRNKHPRVTRVPADRQAATEIERHTHRRVRRFGENREVSRLSREYNESMNCQVKDELVSQLIALNNKLNLLSPDLVHGDEERAEVQIQRENLYAEIKHHRARGHEGKPRPAARQVYASDL
jgi:hypothetical protein